MSLIHDESPTVIVKKKNLQYITDYCIENKIDFTVKSKSVSDEFSIEFLSLTANKAIALGMCLKELRIEPNGLNAVSVAAIKAKKIANQSTATENEMQFAFENDLKFDLGTSN